jgi:hypothetical protein
LHLVDDTNAPAQPPEASPQALLPPAFLPPAAVRAAYAKARVVPSPRGFIVFTCGLCVTFLVRVYFTMLTSHRHAFSVYNLLHFFFPFSLFLNTFVGPIALPGDSLDGFRHYEAVVAGALPVVDAVAHHPHWPWAANRRHAAATTAGGGGGADGWTTQALGWVFPAPLGGSGGAPTRGGTLGGGQSGCQSSRGGGAAATERGGEPEAARPSTAGLPAHWPLPPSVLSHAWLALLLDSPAAIAGTGPGGTAVSGAGEPAVAPWDVAAPGDEPPVDSEGDGLGGLAEAEALRFGFARSPWRRLADHVRVLAPLGPEAGQDAESAGELEDEGTEGGSEDELWLRREVSGRWYLATVCDARRRLHHAVFRQPESGIPPAFNV